MVDAGWQYGSLAGGMEAGPDMPEVNDEVAALLDEAEDIVNSAGWQVMAEQERKAMQRKGWFRKRKKR
jgi:hypothetical protein